MVSLQYIEVFSCQRDLTEIVDTVQSSNTHLSIPVPQYVTLVVSSTPVL